MSCTVGSSRACGPTPFMPEPVAIVVNVKEGQTSAKARVPAGMDLMVNLPANATTGYKWDVVGTSRSFGYPVRDEYFPHGGGEGSGGTQQLTWKTSPMFKGNDMGVYLEYRRPFDKANPAKKLELGVTVY